MTPGRRRGRPVLAVALGIVALLLAAGCTSEGSDASSDASTGSSTAPTTASSGTLPSGTTAPVTATHGLGEGFVAVPGGRKALRGFSEVAVTVTDADGKTCQLCLMAATTEAQRERGLMEVTDPDLGGYDGMLFRFPNDQDGAFWMRNTPMPLSIAYFDQDGKVVSIKDMAPCKDSDDCPSYPAGGVFRYALEVPKGELAEALVAEGSTITIDGLHCPLAKPTP